MKPPIVTQASNVGHQITGSNSGGVSLDFRKQLKGFGLTTANIIYRLPDHRTLLQTYIWQEYDVHPHFPELRKFLERKTRRATSQRCRCSQ